jgi:hypothetical protein
MVLKKRKGSGWAADDNGSSDRSLKPKSNESELMQVRITGVVITVIVGRLNKHGGWNRIEETETYGLRCI